MFFLKIVEQAIDEIHDGLENWYGPGRRADVSWFLGRIFEYFEARDHLSPNYSKTCSNKIGVLRVDLGQICGVANPGGVPILDFFVTHQRPYSPPKIWKKSTFSGGVLVTYEGRAAADASKFISDRDVYVVLAVQIIQAEFAATPGALVMAAREARKPIPFLARQFEWRKNRRVYENRIISLWVATKKRIENGGHSVSRLTLSACVQVEDLFSQVTEPDMAVIWHAAEVYNFYDNEYIIEFSREFLITNVAIYVLPSTLRVSVYSRVLIYDIRSCKVSGLLFSDKLKIVGRDNAVTVARLSPMPRDSALGVLRRNNVSP